MGEYLALCQFQPIQIAAQEDEYIALLPPSGVSILLKKIRFGTGSTQADLPVRIRVRRVSARRYWRNYSRIYTSKSER